MEPTSDRSPRLGRRAFVAAAVGAALSVPLGAAWAGSPAHALDPRPFPFPTDHIDWHEFPLPGVGPVVAALMSDPAGAIWYAEATGLSLVRLSPSTGVTTDFVTGELTNSMVMAPDGMVWFDRSATGVGALDPTTGGITWHTLPTSSPELAAAADGRIWFTDTEHGGIGSIDGSGAVATYTAPGATEVGLIAAAPDGKIWFTRGGGELGVFDPSSGLSQIVSTVLPELTGLVALPSGDIWVGGRNRLVKFAADGSYLKTIPLASRPGWDTIPRMLRAGVHAELYFRATDMGIGRLNIDDSVTFMLPPFEKSAPMGLAVTPAGSVWFAHRFRETLGWF